MKKIKNKFILFIVLCLSTISAVLIFSSGEKTLESRVVLKQWTAMIISNTWNEKMLEVDQWELLKLHDTIKTTSQDALAIVKWWDGSITRLWGVSELRVDENYISSDKTKINIKFELIAWKSWSNVLNYIWEDSSFIQTFNDHEAAVRGTVFDVNLDNDYIFVSNHGVEITQPDNKKVLLDENKALIISQWKIITLLEFIKNFKDTTWSNINKNLDKIRLEDLQAAMIDTLEAGVGFIEYKNITQNNSIAEYIRWLPEDKKVEKFKELLSEYQNIHFANAKTPELMDIKLEIKSALLQLWNTQQRESLLESTLYDVDEVFQTKDPLQFKKVIEIFSDNSDIVDRLNLSIPDILRFERLSDEFNLVIHSQLDIMKETFVNLDFKQLPAFTPEMLKNLQNSADEKIHNFLDTHVDKDAIKDFADSALDSFNWLFNK